MISKAAARFIRISPRKTRLVADMVRGKRIDEALAILMNLEQRPRLYIQEVLKAAVANAAVRDANIPPSDLYISKIIIDGGPMFKRYRAGSMGRAMMIKHRTSHILIELDKKEEKIGKIEVRKGKIEKRPPTIDHRPPAKTKPKVKKMAAANPKG